MLGKIDQSPQLEVFRIPLKHLIKADHELLILSQRINWDKLEQELSVCSTFVERSIFNTPHILTGRN